MTGNLKAGRIERVSLKMWQGTVTEPSAVTQFEMWPLGIAVSPPNIQMLHNKTIWKLLQMYGRILGLKHHTKQHCKCMPLSFPATQLLLLGAPHSGFKSSNAPSDLCDACLLFQQFNFASTLFFAHRRRFLTSLSLHFASTSLFTRTHNL